MKNRKLTIVVVLALVAAAGAIVTALLLRNPTREIGRTANPDGTFTVSVGTERLFVLWGVEVTYAVRDKTGATLYSTGVRDECPSWSDARRKHGAPSPILLGSP